VTSVAQRSFVGGELSPKLYARCDEVKYQDGLRTLRNFLIMKSGGAASRPGTNYIGEVMNSADTVRLFPFEISETINYVLEAGQQYFRVIYQDQYVTDLSETITNIQSVGGETIITVTSNVLMDEQVYLTGIGGMWQLNNRTFQTYDETGTSFKIKDLQGNDVNSSTFNAYTSGGQALEIYEIGTPYAYTDLPLVKYAQSVDVMEFAHNDYLAQQLSFISNTDWTMGNTIIGVQTASPSILEISGPSGSPANAYVVSAIDQTTYEESLPSASLTAPGVATGTSPNTIYFQGASTDILYNIYKINDSAGSNSYGFIGSSNPTAVGFVFTLSSAQSVTAGAVYSYGGNDYTAVQTVTSSTTIWMSGTVQPGTSGTLTKVSGTGPTTMAFTSNKPVISFIDIGADPDLTEPPQTARDPFETSIGGNPGCVAYIQQRLTYGNLVNFPERVEMSQTGKYLNFNVSIPSVQSDGVEFDMVGSQINPIKHILDIGGMIILTEKGEWAVNNQGQGAITPSNIYLQQQTAYGCTDLKPIVIGQTAIYVQARGNVVRDLAFMWQTQGYIGNDLTIFSSHLFENYTIVDWCYQQIPNSVIWAVRNDGILLGLTYIKEQQIWGWHRHDFQNEYQSGFVENAVSIPDPFINEDAVYVVIRRVINGVTKRYVEKLTTRTLTQIEDFVGVDSNISYNGWNTTPPEIGGATITLTTTTGGWTSEDLLDATASIDIFNEGMVGQGLQFQDPGTGEVYQFNITSYVSSTVVQGFPSGPNYPTDMQDTPLWQWATSISILQGLWHLEGQTVSVFGDGYVIASPNNDQYETQLTVTNGYITLPRPYGIIQCGLPYIYDIETLDIDSSSDAPIRLYTKRINQVAVNLNQSRGFFAGIGELATRDDPAIADNKNPVTFTGDPLCNLNEYKVRNFENYEEPVSLHDEVVKVNITTTNNQNGRVFIRGVDPIPTSILSIIPSGDIPLGGQGGGKK
jgi:hypothetical protein